MGLGLGIGLSYKNSTLTIVVYNLGHIKKIACLASPPDLKYSPDLKIVLIFFFKKNLHIWCKNSKNNIFLVEKKLKWRISPEQVMFNVMYCIHSCTHSCTLIKTTCIALFILKFIVCTRGR